MVKESVEANKGIGRDRVPLAFEYRKVFNTVALAMGDAAALSVALLLSVSVHWLVVGSPIIQWWIEPILPIWFVGALFFRLYPGWGLGAIEELRRQVLTILTVFSFYALLVFWNQWTPEMSGFAFSLFFIFGLVLIPVIRRLVKTVLVASGRYGLPVVIYGAGDTGREVLKALRSDRGLGYIPIAFLDDHPAFWGERIDGVPVIGDTNLVLPEAPAAILAMPRVEREFQTHLIEGPLSYYRNVIIIPDLPELPSLWVRTFDLGGMLGLGIQCNLIDPIARFAKRAFDLSVVLLTAPLWIPLFLIISAALWLENHQSPLYCQERPGRRNLTFNTLYFRIVVPDAENVLSERSKETRITRLGRFLRSTSLEKIPLLFSVMAGDMSLVGPRPLPLYPVEELTGSVEFLRRRVRPGMTGLWQVSGKSDIGTTGMDQLDSYYIRNWSIWLDIVVLVRTFNAVVKSSGAY